MTGYTETTNMDDNERKSIIEEVSNIVMLKVKDEINKVVLASIESDNKLEKKIDKLYYISETQSNNLDKVLKFMEESKNKPLKEKEENKSKFVGALISSSVSFLIGLIFSKIFK